MDLYLQWMEEAHVFFPAFLFQLMYLKTDAYAYACQNFKGKHIKMSFFEW